MHLKFIFNVFFRDSTFWSWSNCWFSYFMQQNEIIIPEIKTKNRAFESIFLAKISSYTGTIELAEGVVGNRAQLTWKLNMNSSLKICKKVVFVVWSWVLVFILRVFLLANSQNLIMSSWVRDWRTIAAELFICFDRIHFLSPYLTQNQMYLCHSSDLCGKMNS